MKTKTRFSKQILSILLCVAMLMSYVPAFSLTAHAATTNAYDGTPVTPTKITESNYAAFGLTADNWSSYNGYYGIRTAAELYGFANLVNSGNNYSNGVLLQDIVVNETVSASGAAYSWTPIGNSGNPYLGTFDGNGCTISGIYINGSGGEVGLFGRLGQIWQQGGIVKNLFLTNSYICGSSAVGGIVGALDGDYATVSKCKVDSTVSIYATHESEPYVGGITGTHIQAGFGDSNVCTVSDCVSFAAVKAVNADDYVGAVVGFWRLYSNAAELVVCNNCYYLEGCATDKNGEVQDGTGGYGDYNNWCTALSSADASHTCVSVEHKEVKGTCQYPGHSAYSECLICGKVTSGSKTGYALVGHSFTTATCTTPATCIYCGLISGGKDASNHASSGTAYQLNGADDKKHDQYHTCCKAIIKTEKHKFSGTTCTVCSYKCTHSEMNAGKCTNCEQEGTPYIQPIWNAETQTMDYVRALSPEMTKTFSGNSAELSSGWYIVNGSQSLYGIKATGTVNIILADGSNLQTTVIARVLSGNTLNIYAQSIDPSVMGRISATSGDYEAAMGGSLKESVGTINIYGGVINAGAAGSGAGIGRGERGKEGYLTVHGGIVTASSINVTSMTVNGGIILSSSTSGTVNQTNGLYFNGANGVICGELYTLPHNWTLPSGKTLTINEGETLIVPAGVTLTVEGSIINNGTIKKYGTIICKSGHSYSSDCDEDCNICGEKRSGSSAHSWVNATCFAPKHCSECGTIEGDVHHNYENGICTVCGQDTNGHFYISTAKQLMDFAAYVNLGNKIANATLMANIDLDGYEWTPIGVTAMGEGVTDGYAGTFDGNGHVISNVAFAKPNGNMAAGIFGTVQSTGIVKHLGVENFTFDNNDYDHRAGGIAGQLLGGKITDCYVVNSTVKASSRVVGGIVGMNKGTVENCYTYNVSLAGAANRFGGICGDFNGGTVTNCYTDYSAIGSTTSSVGTTNQSEASVDANRFASGEITYKLNGKNSDGELVWYQTLTEDAYPQFDGSVVYYDETNGYNNHVHTWKYETDGTTITATCTADGCTNTNGGSVTIVAPTELTYDGTVKEATYTGSINTGETVQIVYTSTTDELVGGKPFHAGDYTASITLGEGDNAKTVSIEFTIDKTTPTADDFVFTAPSDLVYNGLAKHATIVPKDGIVGMGEITYINYYVDGIQRNDASGVAYYTVQIHTAEGDNYTEVDWLKNPDVWKFTISYLRTDAVAIVSGTEGSNGWYVGEVTLTAPEGYEISKKQYLSGFGSTSLTFSAEQNETVTYYLKNASGYIAEKKVELKIDLTDPTAEYQIGTDGWKKFINTISFGLFCKDYKTVEIKYTDENSGVATKQYYIANAELSEDELKNVQWNDYTETLNLNATGKYFIYIRVVDNAGREVVLNSEGIVVYADSEAVTESVSTTYHAEADKDVEVKFNGNTVKEIKNGNTVLNSADYTVDTANGIITLKAAYLDTLNAGTYTFTVSYNPQGVETDKVTLATTTFEVVVEKADVSNVKVPTAITGLIYNGEPQALVSAGSANGGEMQYSLDGVTYSKNVPTATNADEYTVYYKVVGDGNHNDVAAQTVTVKIAPKPIIVTIENKTSVYGNDLAALTATDNGIVSGDTNVYKLSTDASSSAIVGKYDITGEAVDGNYDITFKNESNAYEITKRELTLTVTVDDKPYDGTNTATINNVVINNVVGSDAVQVEYGTATFNSVDAANGIGITFTEFVLSGADASNYTLKQPTGVTANITNNWIPTEYAVNGIGWMNYDFLITANDGYKISLTNTVNGKWSDSLTASVEGENSVKFYLKNAATGEISLEKTVSYKLDKNTEATGTTGKVYFDERNGWETFLNTISFGLFYKDEVTVKAEANDKLSGVERIEYVAFNEAKTFEDVKAISDSGWTEMPTDGVAIAVEDARQFVYFVRITDKAGNVTYLSTDGAEYDTTAPAISGVENGETYYTTRKVTVTEKNVASITLNGEEASESITLEGNKDATYTIVVTDKAGNSTTVTVTMKPIATISEPIDGITNNDVTSDDKDTVQDVIDQVIELLEDDDLTDEEKAALEEIKDKADNLKETIEDAAKAPETENTEKVKDVTAENVTPEDKTDLEKAKADLEKVLEDYGDNYTDDEKKAIEDEIKRIDDALKVIENVENVEELIGKIPENITKNDETVIKAADEAYNALSDYEKSLVDEDAKKALDDAKAALAELNKPADPNSPQTGDNSNLWLWFALLFVSGAGIFGITLNERKRRTANKR